jgi:hypothetical protein
MTEPSDPIQLDILSEPMSLEEDRRRRIEVPPPVRLVAVDDCLLWSPAGLERELDEFYVNALRLEREPAASGQAGHELVYRAENFRVRIEIIERPATREDFRPLTLVVESLPDLIQRLADAEIEHERLRGLTPGMDTILLRDPAGNPVAVGEYSVVL